MKLCLESVRFIKIKQRIISRKKDVLCERGLGGVPVGFVVEVCLAVACVYAAVAVVVEGIQSADVCPGGVGRSGV